MKKFRANIQFDGDGFFGWQIQNQTSPTVQEVFNQALEKVFKQTVKSIGSGRTDTGVHAFSYYVSFEAPFEIPLHSLEKALNSHLPDSIRVLCIEEVPADFRPTNDALEKEYRYYFSNENRVSPFLRHHMSNISYDLDMVLMEKACHLFVGEYDFMTFHCTGSDPKSTIREVYGCSIERAPQAMGGIIPEHYVIKVSGNGFLKQMVRLMVGAIWSVGRGKITLEQLKQELESPTGKHLSAVAPPDGLYKFRVEYKP